MIETNYELEGNYVTIREPLIPDVLPSGLTIADNVKSELRQKAMTGRAHLLIAVGSDAKIQAKPGDYVIVSPSGFASTTTLRIDGVNALILDSIFIVGKITDPTKYIEEDAELERQIKEYKKKSPLRTA